MESTQDRNAAQASAEAARDAAEKAKQDRIDQHRAQSQVRRDLNDQAAHVMENSRPTPTQEENDLIKIGAITGDDLEQPDNPTMPPVHEQRAMIENANDPNAENRGDYRTRQMRRRAATELQQEGGKPAAPAQPAGSPTPAGAAKPA